MTTTNTDIIIPEEQLPKMEAALSNVRPEFKSNKYIAEAIKVLQAGGLRSAIGCYWNAVADDLRRKVMHRSLDLFNKEYPHSKQINEYEDFQDHVSDYDLIEVAYKMGVLSWEGRKLMQQARETRNIFDGHPDSSDPTLFKVFAMMADCNEHILSQEYPIPIIDVNEYINVMDSDGYDKNDLAVEQAFSDLPQIYKDEMAHKLFRLYLEENTSTRLRSSIEFSFPILWKVLSKEIRRTLGNRYDKLVVEGDSRKLELALDLITLVDGLRYVSAKSRTMVFEPTIKHLEDSLDDWKEEGIAMAQLQKLGSVIPDELIQRMVTAMTLTYVGYKGGSMYFARTSFYSNSAAPLVSEMFENFDNQSVEAFVQTVRSSKELHKRIAQAGQLNRLRTLGNILLNKPEIRDDSKGFIENLVDETKTKEFLYSLKNES